MPLYQFRCPKCGKEIEELLPFDHDNPLCAEHSHGKMEQVLTPFSFSIDFRDGFDIGAGRNFNTARERNAYLQENNLKRM